MRVTQQDREPLRRGQEVLLIMGSQARVVPDYTKAGTPDHAGTTAPPVAQGTGAAAPGAGSAQPQPGGAQPAAWPAPPPPPGPPPVVPPPPPPPEAAPDPASSGPGAAAPAAPP